VLCRATFQTLTVTTKHFSVHKTSWSCLVQIKTAVCSHQYILSLLGRYESCLSNAKFRCIALRPLQDIRLGNLVRVKLRVLVMYWMLYSNLYIKLKQFLYRPGQSLRFPGGWGSQFSRYSVNEGGRFVSRTHRPPLFPVNIPGNHFWIDLRVTVRPEG
jgi:hypothetical protein